MTCPSCQSMQEAMEQQAEVIGGLERELRGKRLTIGKLQKELANLQEEHPKRREAQEVWEFWRTEVHPKAREFSGPALKNVLARLSKGHTVDELKQAVLGAKHDAFTSENGVRHDDLELICRNPTKVKSFQDRYHAWAERNGTLVKKAEYIDRRELELATALETEREARKKLAAEVTTLRTQKSALAQIYDVTERELAEARQERMVREGKDNVRSLFGEAA